jgi:hypothetical protein
MIQIKNRASPGQTRPENRIVFTADPVRIPCATPGLYRPDKGAFFMTDENENALDTARRRLRIAEEKFDRQQRRYAMRALEADKGIATARTALAEAEAELEASREALRKLEALGKLKEG